jgi:hypothetical protein
MDTPSIIMIIGVIALMRLGALALRLRSRTRYQNRQHQTLVAMATRLPADMRVELDDPHGNGTQLRLRTHVSPPLGQGQHVRS